MHCTGRNGRQMVRENQLKTTKKRNVNVTISSGCARVTIPHRIINRIYLFTVRLERNRFSFCSVVIAATAVAVVVVFLRLLLLCFFMFCFSDFSFLFFGIFSFSLTVSAADLRSSTATLLHMLRSIRVGKLYTVSSLALVHVLFQFFFPFVLQYKNDYYYLFGFGCLRAFGAFVIIFRLFLFPSPFTETDSWAREGRP